MPAANARPAHDNGEGPAAGTGGSATDSTVDSTVDTAVDTAIVLAGGLGTRLRAAVPDLPKPMAPVAGRPFLEHLLDYWLGQGVRRFVLSVGYRAEVIRAHFGTRYRDAAIDYAVETTPLGTGGGLLLAAGLATQAKGPLLVLNGDTFFALRLAALLAAHRAQAADWTFALFRTAEAGRYMGMTLATDGTIASLQAGAATGERLANGGVYLVEARVLAQLAGRYPASAPLSLEARCLPDLLAAGARLCGAACDGTFIDIGVPDDYRRAATLFT